MRILFVPSLLLILCIRLVVAAEDSLVSTTDFRITRDAPLRMLQQGVSLFTAPKEWGCKEWALAGVILGTTTLLYTQDSRIMEAVQNSRGTRSNALSSVVTHFGEGEVMVPVVLGVYTYGYFAQNVRLRRIAWVTTEGFIIGGAVTAALKLACHRHRPCSQDGPNIWDGPSLSLNHLSFVSGHSFTAFCAATAVALEWRDAWWVGTIAYTLASLTGFSRMNDHKHWASDVFAGAALGTATAAWFYSVNSQSEQKPPTFTVAPLGDGIDASLNIQW